MLDLDNILNDDHQVGPSVFFFGGVYFLSLSVSLSSSSCWVSKDVTKHSCHVYGETSSRKAIHPHFHPRTEKTWVCLESPPQPQMSASVWLFSMTFLQLTHTNPFTHNNTNTNIKQQSCFLMSLVFLLLFYWSQERLEQY